VGSGQLGSGQDAASVASGDGELSSGQDVASVPSCDGRDTVAELNTANAELLAINAVFAEFARGAGLNVAAQMAPRKFVA